MKILFDRYDSTIQAASDEFLGKAWPWERFWALGYQESRYQLNAVSPVGARGPFQFMPATWDEESRRIGLGGASPENIETAARVAASYLSQLHRIWADRVGGGEAKQFAEASYNAGTGAVYRRWSRAGRPTSLDLVPLPDETRNYVRLIRKWYELKLSALGRPV